MMELCGSTSSLQVIEVRLVSLQGTMENMAQAKNGLGYTGTAKALHWLIVALLIVQFMVAWIMPEIRRDTKPDTLINLHLTFGVVILAVAILRLSWRATHPEPAQEAGLPPWQVRSAHIIHLLLYLLLFVVPILGWISASYRGFPVIMFGVELPKLIATRAPGFRWTGDVHGLLANYAMLALVGLHVAAALYHYFIRRDGVLQRMLPGA
jgi:cytochrome b561